MKPVLALSINTSWNLVNFRSNLIERFQREGYAVVALSPEDGYGPELEKLGVEHIPLPMDNKGISPVEDLKLLRRYWHILGKVRPAAYLGWTIKPNVYGSMAARARGIPVINNISGLGTAFIKQSPITHVVRGLYRAALSRSTTVFFQNRFDRDLFVTGGLVAAKQTALLPGSGIDLSKFDPGVGCGGDVLPPKFLMVARLLRDKGVVEFADAARIVRRQRPDVDFHLLGFLDAPNRTAIGRDMIEGWEAEGILLYLGDTADVRPYLLDATAVVLPSYREGMPRSLLEAAAMGRPLIATAVPGSIEIARDGQNAVLCEARDARSLAAAMLSFLAKEPHERQAMGRKSRAIAEAEFDVGIIEERYLEAVSEAVRAQPSAHS